MLKTSVTSGTASAGVIGAILLYGPERSNCSEGVQMATIHGMDTIKGVPVIKPGRLITEHDLAEIHKGLSTAHATQSIAWLDQRLLAKGSDRMVWWTSPGTRPMFFKKSSYVKNTFDGAASCPVPALVWMAIQGHGLYVFASSEPGRPTPTTALYQAPFFNVWGRGRVCSGNAHQPQEADVWDPVAWETYFFGSHFTHPNFLEEDRLTKGVDPVKFWKTMVVKPLESFPGNRLVRMPLTAQDLIDPLIVDKLNKLPRPKGEF